MGVRDWFKKKKVETVEKPEPSPELPELDREALVEETLAAFESEDVELTEPDVIEATPEYDSGDVDLDDLLDEKMESNYDKNTVEETEFEDLLDDAIQIYQERHYDGIVRMYLKYKITQDDIDRGQARGGDKDVGITTTTGTSTVGLSTTFNFEENQNYLPVPTSPHRQMSSSDHHSEY